MLKTMPELGQPRDMLANETSPSSGPVAHADYTL